MITNYLPEAALFSVGILTQLFLLIQLPRLTKRDWWIMAGSLAIALIVAFYPDKKEMEYNLAYHLVFFGVLAILFTAFKMREYIIPTIDEKVLLIITLVALYLVFNKHAPFWLILVYASMSVLVILNSLIHYVLPKILKVLLFIWYFILMLTMPILYFKWNIVIDLFKNQQSNLSLLEIFTLGLSVGYVLTFISFLTSFIPSRISGFKEARELVETLDKKYDSTQLAPRPAFILLMITGSLISAQHFFDLIPDYFILSAVFLLSGVVGKSK